MSKPLSAIDIGHMYFDNMEFRTRISISDRYTRVSICTRVTYYPKIILICPFVSVFHKDMCYHVLSNLLQDEEYLQSQTHIFLVRNPWDAVLSLATVHPDLDFNTLGFAEMPVLYERIKEVSGTSPLVIDAADLASDPIAVLTQVCDYIGIAFKKEALCWNASMPKEWESWSAWHKEAASRGSIGAPGKNYTVSYHSHPHLKKNGQFLSAVL